MYTGNAARIYNPHPDPDERGPPKRVTRDESHIGEMVAASKKRISWRFTLGESDVTHEVVLVHSIMSYKKVVEFDGRQMHYSATFTPGDWKFLMVLEGSNHVFEVRINDLESADVPKYDLAVDRIPYRRWDVYRRRKQPITTATYAQPLAAQQPTSTFGTQRWGPSGMSAPPPPPEPTAAAAGGRYGGYPNGGNSSASAYNREGRSSSFSSQRDSGGNRSSFTGGDRSSFTGVQRDSGGSRNSFTGSLPYQQPQPTQTQQRRSSGQFSAQSAPAPTVTAATVKKQPEIDLIGDFGPSVSVSAQTLLFDPFAAGSTFTAPTAPQPQPHASTNNARTSSSPAFAPLFSSAQPTAAPYVDPFATVAQAAPLKPVAAPMTIGQFAAPSTAFQQPSGSMYAPPSAFQQPMAMAMQQPMPVMQTTVQQQPQPMAMTLGANRVSVVPQQQHVAPALPAQQSVQSSSVNYSISQLMNPVEVNGAPPSQRQAAKTINIDAFAGMG